VDVGNLQVCETLIAADGAIGPVEAVTVSAAPQTMYNLTVAHVATYLVGDGQWVVHNQNDVPIGFTPERWMEFIRLAERYVNTLRLPDGRQLPGGLILQGSRVPGAVDQLTGVRKIPRAIGDNLSDIDLGFRVEPDVFNILDQHARSQATDIPNRIIRMLDSQQRFDKQGIFSRRLQISPNFPTHFWTNFVDQFADVYGKGNVDYSIIKIGGTFDTPPYPSPVISICTI
jgi:hypothetical protein